MSILLTGGAGYIGSHTAVVLAGAGYDVVVLDNFYNSKRSVVKRIETAVREASGNKKHGEIFSTETDLTDKEGLKAVFKEFPDIECVVHFAAMKAVGESVEKPFEYYENNLVGTLNLLEIMREHNVKRFVFSSSATVYGADNPVPLRESGSVGSATNPYGWTKIMTEQILRDISAIGSDFAAVMLRYFNPIGAHESGLIGEDPQGIPNNLLPYVAKVATGELPRINIFGDDYDTPDGTCIRDYIHVMDLAEGHLLAMEYLNGRTGCHAFNLGTGKGTSVKEIIAAFEKACGKKLPAKIAPRRAGDIAEIYASVDLAAEKLGFKATRNIEKMCEDAWRWQQGAG
jgi:UDP-glucose 4-epimerase